MAGAGGRPNTPSENRADLAYPAAHASVCDRPRGRALHRPHPTGIRAEIRRLAPAPMPPQANSASADLSSRGVLPVQRLQAWLNELASSKPRSQATLEIGMLSSSR